MDRMRRAATDNLSALHARGGRGPRAGISGTAAVLETILIGTSVAPVGRLPFVYALWLYSAE